jgi:tetratricopeptide (TPR) repeat protein
MMAAYRQNQLYILRLSSYDERYKSQAFTAIASAANKLNDSGMAKQVFADALEVTKSIKEEYYKSQALSAIAAAYVKIGDKVTATAILNEATKSAELLPESNAIKEAAQIHAELGDWGEALRLSHRCMSGDRLTVLARILRVHAEQKNPEFKVLREEKPDEAEE